MYINVQKCTLGIYETWKLDMFYKIGVLKNSAKFTGNDLCQSPFFSNVAGTFLNNYFIEQLREFTLENAKTKPSI